MPIIIVEGGQMTSIQKKELISKMTQLASEVMQIPPDFFMFTIKELPDENIGIGGKTIDIIKENYNKQT
ncbi:MAG: tautomerase family protein [Dysgonamonadaceae bacterium]|jgi:4-oxalocrotonate tautomerase|nr:tautomerase family protein [Dysgonamonadaceae bacterium]